MSMMVLVLIGMHVVVPRLVPGGRQASGGGDGGEIVKMAKM